MAVCNLNRDFGRTSPARVFSLGPPMTWLFAGPGLFWPGDSIQRIEKSSPAITGYVSTMVRIQAAFEQAGIYFIDRLWGQTDR